MGAFAAWEIARRLADWQGINLADYRMLAFALLLILMMILRPKGLMGIHEIWETGPARRLWAMTRRLWAMTPFGKIKAAGAGAVKASGGGGGA